MANEIVELLSKNEKWLSYEETGSVGSINASSARSKRLEPSGVEKSAGTWDSTDAGMYGTDACMVGWVGSIIWLIGWSR
jgi:hypothetical protein